MIRVRVCGLLARERILSRRLISNASAALFLMVGGVPAVAGVFGADFDSLPPGPYPFGSPGMIELVDGDPAAVRVATSADVPVAYREVANAAWITAARSGVRVTEICLPG